MKITQKTRDIIRHFTPYITTFALLMALIIIGSQKNTTPTTSGTPIMSAINEANYVVTADQLSESFIVADLANSVNLPSYDTINENFVSLVIKHETSQTNDTKIEKPNIIDTSDLSRGIEEYIVQDGDTLDSIAAKFNVTTTQIRWSNNMKNDNISPLQKLFIPTIPGILYTVKSGDTVESLAEKYQSNAEQIITYNDLETSGLTTGATIILPNGQLPDVERPEYVPPAPRPSSSYSYISSSNSNTRLNVREIGSSAHWRNEYNATKWQNNPGAYGNCTWFAWYWRRQNMGSEYWLPGGTIGNAGYWNRTLSGSFYIDHNPRYGDVVQTDTRNPGHVGVVTAVHEDGSITIREMNSIGYNRVNDAEIPAEVARSYNYIHQHK
jgi:surface antigen